MSGLRSSSQARLVAGVDGCPAGWIAVVLEEALQAPPQVLVTPRFADLLVHLPWLDVLAVDMPIGLPDRIGPEGRGPERHVRPLLGTRQSSVFSVPSRAAVYCEDYREACRIAQETSEPPRKVSKQAFHLFPKIRELDKALAGERQERVFEVHPEVAFWRLNGGAPMSLPKKIKSRINPDGMDERRACLAAHGLSPAFLSQKPPRGAGADDLLDACVNAIMALHILAGRAEPFPKDFLRDSQGHRIAIWA
ncbi:DUF429 domain-containing protein [Pannonibacter phragmitetus]|uniref:DUF429 domain-containing protein n=1 Tax=Pannonibacter phragmitetus TaxID=121719 RepID=UPI003D2EB099